MTNIQEAGLPDQPSPDSGMIVKFNAPGSALFTAEMVGIVTPAQMFALAGWLDFKARQMFTQLELAQQTKGIAIPNVTLPRNGNAR